MLIDEHARTMFEEGSQDALDAIRRVSARAKSSLREYRRRAVHTKMQAGIKLNGGST